MSAGYLAGNADFAPRREAKQREVETALQPADAALAHHSLPDLVTNKNAVRTA